MANAVLFDLDDTLISTLETKIHAIRFIGIYGNTLPKGEFEKLAIPAVGDIKEVTL